LQLKENMVELEEHTSLMAWYWDAEDIDLQEDDGKMWVPVTAQTLKIDMAKHKKFPPANPVMLPRQMTVRATLQ